MENKQKLSIEETEQITGGVQRTINTGIDGMNAAIRSGAGTSYGQIASLPNGSIVDTITDELYYDPISNRNFVQITYVDKYGKSGTGWVAASIVGLPR